MFSVHYKVHDPAGHPMVRIPGSHRSALVHQTAWSYHRLTRIIIRPVQMRSIRRYGNKFPAVNKTAVRSFLNACQLYHSSIQILKACSPTYQRGCKKCTRNYFSRNRGPYKCPAIPLPHSRLECSLFSSKHGENLPAEFSLYHSYTSVFRHAVDRSIYPGWGGLSFQWAQK